MTAGAEHRARKPYAIYAITKHGAEIASRLAAELPGAQILASKRVIEHCAPGAELLALPMGPALAENFQSYDCHIFVISVGAVVRMIAPHLDSKKVDPAVVCVDDAARFSICVLSGHVGRGNFFTDRVARILGAEPVVTTASDVRGTLTVDILGRDLGWRLDDPDRNVTAGCAAVVNASPVALVQCCGSPEFWPLEQPLPPGVQYFTSLDDVDPERFEMLLVVSDERFEASHPRHFHKAVIYRPPSLVLGLGCDKNTPPDLVARGVDWFLGEHGLSKASVCALATIDLKAEEPAFLELSRRETWPLLTYPAAELDRVEGIENPSEVVKKYVGTRSVGEAACLLAAGASRLLHPKRSYTEAGAERSMTLAVARKLHPPRNANR